MVNSIMWVEDYQWHYDYVRLSWDTGFSFEKCKSPNLDKNKICVVDVDRIVKERDVASVDRYISTVIQYILDEEQAKVLDTNFVKIFRISQLAVEYLLFCKKYLDNTVVLLKKELTKNREENKELKVFTEDLQTHVETLVRQQAIPNFKCSFCSKVFSSEEYLNAHIKRRHNNQSTESYNSETDKLNFEIKELKERLNNTEKLLKEKDCPSPEKSLPNMVNDNLKITEVLEKFETFKIQVDNELKELKVQKSFYEENYGKLFDIVIQNKENIEPKKQIPKTETTTQTDKLLHIENVNDKNVVEIQELFCTSSSEDLDKNREAASKIVISQQGEKESLEARMSTTLAGIEGQMHAFWDKLNEIEQNKPNNNLQSALTNVLSSVLPENGDTLKQEVKPKAKPRSKLSQPTHNTREITNNTKKLKMAIEEQEELLKNNELKVILNHNPCLDKKSIETVDHSLFKEDSNSAENSDSESTESESEVSNHHEKYINASKLGPEKHVNIRPRPPAYSSHVPEHKEQIVVKKHSLTRLEKDTRLSTRKTATTKKMFSINKDIEVLVGNRLQELGISENWKHLPERSFDKALEIINHQSRLTKKIYPNFNNIKKKIISDVEKQCNRKLSNKTQLEIGSKTQKLEQLQNIVKVSYRPKSGKKNIDQRNPHPSHKRETVEIKNRALYETDSESEPNFKQTMAASNLNESHRRYSGVVEELKSLPKVQYQTDEDSMDEVHKDAQKGVLKSFPSVGSLSKKKVLFDLESQSSKIEDALVIAKAGGSTTSIASSILGDKVDTANNEVNDKEKLSIKKVEKEFDDLSDFDLSDLQD